MAIPASPQNFYVQQGNGQVALSWSISVGATSYAVQRSLDGVTYSSLTSVTTNGYLDSTVSTGSIYYYQIASVNSSGTSAYSTPQSTVPTLQGQMSLGEMRLRAQQRADMVGSNFVTVPEWNYYINQGYYWLYDLLITVYEDYYVAPRLTFATTGANSYALPTGANYSAAPAFYKLFGVDLGLDSSNNAFVTLKKFDFISRNRYVFPQITSQLLGVFNLQYRVVGGNIMFIPVPSANQTVGLWYYPRLTTLIRDTDVMDGISGWADYPIIYAARCALNKQDWETASIDAELMAMKQRIEESATNRDAGQPDTISDTKTWSERWGGFGGVGYDGPSGGY